MGSGGDDVMCPQPMSDEQFPTLVRNLVLTAVIAAVVIPIGLLIWKSSHIYEMNLGEWGDFLAGAFGPAALLVVTAGLFAQREELILQRREIKNSIEALREQKTELSRQASESETQSKILDRQINIYRNQEILDRWSVLRSEMSERAYDLLYALKRDDAPKNIAAAKISLIFELNSWDKDQFAQRYQMKTGDPILWRMHKIVNVWNKFIDVSEIREDHIQMTYFNNTLEAELYLICSSLISSLQRAR